MRVKFLAGLYVLLLVAIVYCADHFKYQYLFSPIRSIPGGDKCGHFLLMGMFAGLLNLCLSCHKVKVAGITFLLGSVVVVTLITIEEATQIYIPYRSFDLFDLTADYLGVLIFGRVSSYLCSKREAEVIAETQP